MINCPYCGAMEVPDTFPSASQRFSTYKYICGTEIVFCGSATTGLIEWKCTDGPRKLPNNAKTWLGNMTEKDKNKLQEILARLSRR